jgi:callose synthase
LVCWFGVIVSSDLLIKETISYQNFLFDVSNVLPEFQLIVSLIRAGLNRKQRLFSGILMAGLAYALTFTFLEPLFIPVKSDTAMVFLYVLSLYGATVGASLGVLLPLFFPGVCLGTVMTLLAGCFFQDSKFVASEQFFPLIGGVLAVCFAFLSSR